MAGNQNITGVNVTGNLHANDISVVIEHQLQDSSPKNIRFHVEKPLQTFTGREAFLEELHKIVTGSQSIREGRITVLTQAPISVVAATGGIGKTETVRMYIQLHAHEYDHVVWIDAEEALSGKNQFIQLAFKLGISTDFDGKSKEFELILEQIFEKLLQNAHVVLVVFDNAEAFEDDSDLNLNGIRSLLPKSFSPFFVEPTVIVTSRNQNWSLQKVIQLDLWTEAEVVVFLIQSLGLQETPANVQLAIRLGNRFGRLPIALQAAVAVILHQNKRKKKYGIQNLLDEYQNGCRKVLAQKPWDANMRITKSRIVMLVLWNISLEKIVKFPDGQLAIKILCFMAYLSPTSIPQGFLYALFQNDFTQDSFENALEILDDYSLISSLSSDHSDSHSFSIHRMIQDATIENLKASEGQKPSVVFNEKTFLNGTEVLLKLSAKSMNYMKTLNTRVLPRAAEVVENLVQIAHHVSKKLEVKEFRGFTEEVALISRSTNDFTKAIELYEKVLKATTPSDVESEICEKLELTWDLARAYKDGGLDQKSIELLKEDLKDATRDLGPHHRTILVTKSDIASALGRLGKYDEAAAIFREVLQDFKNNEHTGRETFIMTKHNYAVLLKDQGKTEEALKLLTEVLEECEKNRDWKSDSRISAKGNIAFLLGQQGKFDEASAMMLQNILDATQVFGPFHLNTFTFKQNYGQLLAEHGKYKEAVQLFLELLEIQVTELGSDHPSTQTSKIALAVSYTNTQEFDKALLLLDLKASERLFGPEHPRTMTTASNIANVKEKQKKFGDALSLYNKILKIQEKSGPNHPDALITMRSIGVVHFHMAELGKAAEVFEDLWLRQKNVFGDNDSKTIATLDLLTVCREILDM